MRNKKPIWVTVTVGQTWWSSLGFRLVDSLTGTEGGCRLACKPNPDYSYVFLATVPGTDELYLRILNTINRITHHCKQITNHCKTLDNFTPQNKKKID